MKIERWIKLKYMEGVKRERKRERYIRRQGRERERDKRREIV